MNCYDVNNLFVGLTAVNHSIVSVDQLAIGVAFLLKK